MEFSGYNKELYEARIKLEKQYSSRLSILLALSLVFLVLNTFMGYKQLDTLKERAVKYNDGQYINGHFKFTHEPVEAAQ